MTLNDTKTLFLVGCLFALSTTHLLADTVAGPLPFDESKSLELEGARLANEKLALEIGDLKKKQLTIDWLPYVQGGTLLSALLALVVSMVSSNRSNRRQIESLTEQRKHNEKERVSELLHELGNEKLAVKISSVQALKEYTSAYSFIANILALEHENSLVEAASRVLASQPEVALCWPPPSRPLLVFFKL